MGLAPGTRRQDAHPWAPTAMTTYRTTVLQPSTTSTVALPCVFSTKSQAAGHRMICDGLVGLS